MRRLLILLVIPFLCATAEAKPKRRIADWKFWLVNSANIGLSLATTKTIHNCMEDHGLGRCVGGDYGPFPAKEAVRNGFTVGITLPVSYAWKKEDEEEGKKSFWWVFPAANMALNGGTIIRNANRHFPPREKE